MNAKERLEKAETFIVYYGNGRGKEDVLSGYDLAIVEPSGQEPDFVKKVKVHGALVLAYVSVIELPDYSSLCELVSEEDYLFVDGKKARNEEYKNNMMDMDSPKWISILKYHIGDLYYNKGYDGIFLDTIGDVENTEFPLSVQNRMMNAAVNFMKDIRATFSGLLIVQNNGLEKLMEQTAPYLDGICWENPPFDVPASNAWVMIRRDYMVSLSDDGTKILFLTDGSVSTRRAELTQKNADTYHFPYYHAEKGFTMIEE